MVVLNFSELCSGKWTRSECKKGITEKSVLDYVIVRNPMANSLSKILIDEERIISPYWTRTTKKSGEIRQYSDHNAIFVSFTMPRDRGSRVRACDNNKHKFHGWRVTNDGLAAFGEKTEPTHVIGKSGLDVISEFNEYVTTSMDSCFNRKSVHRKKHPNVNNVHILGIK